MSTGWNMGMFEQELIEIINLLGNEYWLELCAPACVDELHYKPTGK